jgi:ADP-ribosylglycohydrolase
VQGIDRVNQFLDLGKYRGSLLGLAVGDALGAAIEFLAPGSFNPITDIVGGGTFQLKAGQWTDDTSMALCLASSLMEQRGFDPVDQMRRYLRWYREGYMSSTGECFDIGNTVRASLHRFEETGDPFSGPSDENTAGNGSLMRVAPIALYFVDDPDQAISCAADSSRTTHGAPAAVDACRYFVGLVIGAIQGRSKRELLSPGFAPVKGIFEQSPLVESVRQVAAGSYKKKLPSEIRGKAYVVDTLEAALWAFWRSKTFREGALLAVNLGDDADTTGAVYGQLAGAYYGDGAIPRSWREVVAMRELIISLADGLHASASLRIAA